jgi:hypothetical protein
VEPHGHRWFTNRGQILQLAVAVLALLNARGALLALMQNQFFSPGALLFYALIASVIASFVWMVRSNRRVATAISSEVPQREAEVPLIRVPKIWVEFKPAEKRSSNPEDAFDSLVFSKDGDTPIRTIHVSPLVWNIQEIRAIQLFNALGPLRAQPMESKFGVLEQVGPATRNRDLPELLREMVDKFGFQAQPSCQIYYEDFDGNWFSRKFTIVFDSFGRIAWQPGSVQLAEPPSAGVAESSHGDSASDY